MNVPSSRLVGGLGIVSLLLACQVDRDQRETEGPGIPDTEEQVPDYLEGLSFTEPPCRDAPIPPGLQPPVTISVANNRVTVNKPMIVLCRGDFMEWVSDGTADDWTVNWKDNAPSPLEPGGPVTPDSGRRQAVGVGLWSYEVTVTLGDTTLSLDPEMVVMPDPVIWPSR